MSDLRALLEAEIDDLHKQLTAAADALAAARAIARRALQADTRGTPEREWHHALTEIAAFRVRDERLHAHCPNCSRWFPVDHSELKTAEEIAVPRGETPGE